MWIYIQRTGELIANDGEVIGIGYSGNAQGKNTPNAQERHSVGPLPRGLYTIGEPTDAHVHLGPFAIPLTPQGQEMFGRNDMWIHGDSILNPGFASDGCIVQPKTVRQRVAKSDDKLLNVIADRADLVLEKQELNLK